MYTIIAAQQNDSSQLSDYAAFVATHARILLPLNGRVS